MPPAPRGFVRHDLYLGAGLLCLVLAVVVPQAVRHGAKGAAVALGGVLGVLAAGILAVLAILWLIDRAGQPGPGLAIRALGLVLRFLLCAAPALVVAGALCGVHEVARPDPWLLGAGCLGGALGTFLHLRLGPARFWPAFRRLGFTLLICLPGGLLGLLVPGTWGVDLGIGLPLLAFVILATIGRIAPPISVSSKPDNP